MKTKNILIVLVLMILVPLLSFRAQETKAPEPEDYVRMFMETIGQNDSVLYVRRFGIDTSDFRWAMNNICGDPHASPENKERIRSNFFEDTARSRYEIANIAERLGEGYAELQAWSKENNIDLSRLELVRVYFSMRYQEVKNIYMMNTVDLIVRYESRFFHIEIDKVVYVKNRWTMGFIDELEEVDQYFNRITPVRDSPEVPMEADSVAVSDMSATSKEHQKIQKKIEKSQAKVKKLYQQYYDDQ